VRGNMGHNSCKTKLTQLFEQFVCRQRYGFTVKIFLIKTYFSLLVCSGASAAVEYEVVSELVYPF